MKRLGVARRAVLILFICSSWNPMGACTCGPPPICARVGAAKAVIFTGKALNLAYANPSDFHTVRRVRFQVERAYQGLPFGSTAVSVHSAAGSSCEQPFVPGIRYLVFAEADEKGTTFSERLAGTLLRWRHGGILANTNQCAGSVALENATEELKFLNAWAARSTPTVIQGQVLAPADFEDAQARLSGATVTAVDTRGQERTTTIDARGNFEIPGVQPGAYRVTVQRPRFRSDRPHYPLTVPAGGCGDVIVGMSIDGQVSGRLIEPDGRPALPVTVHLVQAKAGAGFSDPETASLEDGTYRFVGVPPGRYYVAVNARSEPNIRIPYQRATSKEFVLAEAAAVSQVDVKMSSRMRPRTITAQVTWADGSPAILVHVWCSAKGYAPWQHEQTDSFGRIRFDVLDGLAYEVGAAAASNYDIVSRQKFSAEPVQVPPGQSAAVRLTLSIPPPKK